MTHRRQPDLLRRKLPFVTVSGLLEQRVQKVSNILNGFDKWMSFFTPTITLLEYLDSDQMAARCRQELDIQRYETQLLGVSAVEAAQ